MSEDADIEMIMKLPERKPAHPDSIPVRYCDLHAATHSKTKFKEIHRAMHHNLKLGSFKVLPCTCTPRCPELNMAEQMVLADLFQEDPDFVNMKNAISGNQ